MLSARLVFRFEGEVNCAVVVFETPGRSWAQNPEALGFRYPMLSSRLTSKSRSDTGFKVGDAAVELIAVVFRFNDGDATLELVCVAVLEKLPLWEDCGLVFFPKCTSIVLLAS